MRLQAAARLGPTTSSGSSAPAAWVRCTRHATHGSDDSSRSRFLRQTPPASRARRQRFEREARTISHLVHPHICTLFDTGEEAGVAFLVMEYLPGETLGHRLLRGPLPLREALQIAVHLADALDVAHRQGVTHRDLKPSNVMLTPAGRRSSILASPAGIARLRTRTISKGRTPETSDPTLTHPGGIVGTLQYMAPEQFNGRPDARSDLFALGAIIFEMVTGRKAFAGDTNSAVVSAIESGETPSMGARALTPPALDRVVGKCLADGLVETMANSG